MRRFSLASWRNHRGRALRAAVVWSVCLAAALAGSLSGGVRAESFSEEQVRAGYLFNFALFVRWPDEAFEDPATPFRYCVMGNPAVRDILERMLAGETVQGRPLELAAADGPSAWRRCHVLYVDRGAGFRTAEVLTSVQGAAVLTVGDSEEFARGGGMVGLVRKGWRVRPVINSGAATDAGIRVSAKLLQMATLVAGDVAGKAQ